MTQLTRVLNELMGGPATVLDIADATGLPRKHAGRYLADLVQLGIATRKPVPNNKSRPYFIYTAKVRG
jgi:predicted transcriptional regulator